MIAYMIWRRPLKACLDPIFSETPRLIYSDRILFAGPQPPVLAGHSDSGARNFPRYCSYFPPLASFVVLLQECLGILAYDDPELSPLANVFHPSRRALTASTVNKCILSEMRRVSCCAT